MPSESRHTLKDGIPVVVPCVRLEPHGRHNGHRRYLPAHPRVPVVAHLTMSSLRHSASTSVSRTILLTGDAEAREVNYMASGSYTRS